MSPPAPSTPTRPARSSPSSASSQSLPPLTPDTFTPVRDHSLDTPGTPPTTSPSRRKSTASIHTRRKPVPLSPEHDIALEDLRGRALNTPTTAATDPFSDTRYAPSTSSVEPPRYVLDVAPPPTYHTGHASSSQAMYVESGLPSAAVSREQLPVYAEDVQTEPDTLARKCWLWGFLFPILWLVGMSILCIPLKPVDEEEDVDKAQKMEEMIVILRKVELKYARRCAWSFAVFAALLSLVIVIAVVVSRFSR